MVNTWVKNQPRDAWVDPGVHDDRIRCSRSPDYAISRFFLNNGLFNRIVMLITAALYAATLALLTSNGVN